jgi:hypothetical protein
MTSLKDKKIELSPKHADRLRALGMNWSCTTQRPFEFRPTTFVASIEGLKPKTFTQQMQVHMVDSYVKHPSQPCLIGISSAPNDGQSKLLAAWMMEQHLIADYNNRPLWHDLMGGFKTNLLDEEPLNITMLVLNNIGPDSSQTKKEKFRDILERYADIPIVVVVNGSDAFTFFTRDMRKPCQGVIYLASGLAKKTHEL